MKRLALNKWYIILKELCFSLLKRLFTAKMCNILFLIFTTTFSQRVYKYPMEMLILHSANLVMGQLIKIHLTSVNLYCKFEFSAFSGNC